MTQTHHWANQQERGNRWFLTISIWLVRYVPTFLLRCIIAIICLYFYLTAPKQRQAVAQYQRRLQQYFPHLTLPRFARVYRQFAAFGEAIADRFAVWQKKILYADLVVHDPDNLYHDMDQIQQRGQILLCSHLGNVEVCRALVQHHKQLKLNVLVHTHHAVVFNQALEKAGADRIQLIQVSELDAPTMLQLSQKIEQGEWLAIAADRIPVRSDKTISLAFLGHDALFPQGAWLLAYLLKAKTNTLFLIKQQGRYHLFLQRFADIPQWKRQEREVGIQQYAQAYAHRLEEYVYQAPLQWFNFYHFWKD